jgi:hypothetical protein
MGRAEARPDGGRWEVGVVVSGYKQVSVASNFSALSSWDTSGRRNCLFLALAVNRSSKDCLLRE